MTPTTDALDNLEIHLQPLLALMAQFVTCLRTEQQALTQARFDDLPSLTEQKQQLAQAIDAGHLELRQALQQAGAPASALNDWFKLQALHPAVGTWHQLLQSTRLASILNQSNAELMANWQKQNQQLMQLLHGAAGSAAGYDAQGRSTTFLERLRIDLA